MDVEQQHEQDPGPVHPVDVGRLAGRGEGRQGRDQARDAQGHEHRKHGGEKGKY